MCVYLFVFVCLFVWWERNQKFSLLKLKVCKQNSTPRSKWNCHNAVLTKMWFRNLLPNKGNTKETQGEKDLSRSGETNENLNAMRIVMIFFVSQMQSMKYFLLTMSDTECLLVTNECKKYNYNRNDVMDIKNQREKSKRICWGPDCNIVLISLPSIVINMKRSNQNESKWKLWLKCCLFDSVFV